MSKDSTSLLIFSLNGYFLEYKFPIILDQSWRLGEQSLGEQSLGEQSLGEQSLLYFRKILECPLDKIIGIL
jgi:hypothetical protein